MRSLIGGNESNLICTQTTWSDIALFFIANYFVHCLTIKSYPAETRLEVGIAMVLSLFLPGSGISRAMDAIIRHSRWAGGNVFEKAARARALCMVVRTDGWKAKVEDILKDLEIVKGQEVLDVRLHNYGTATRSLLTSVQL